MVTFQRAVNFEFLHENPQIKLFVTFCMLEEQFISDLKVGDLFLIDLAIVTNLK